MNKKILLNIVTAVAVSIIPNISFAQAPNLGSAANFVLFSSNGAVGNTGISHLTGNVGTNSGASTAFGNVDGVMHDNDGASAAAATDLLAAYNELNSAVPVFFPAPLLGNGATLFPGIYSISADATLSNTLSLDAKGDPSAVFIFQIQAPFSTNAYSAINLVNGALACNVFWKIEGLVSMATGTTMRGTVIANNAAIEISTGVELEGRALSTTGAVSVDGVLAYTPTGCGSPLLSGPAAPELRAVGCYALFSSDGDVTNSGVSSISGDIGTNGGLTTGFDSSTVNGSLHSTPDGSTAVTASDLLDVYSYLNTLPFDIELLYPVQLGNSLVLTPHTYLLNAAAVFTDTLFLNAKGYANSVFVIKINGALSTSTYSAVILTNGAKSENVFWLVEGAVDINDYSNFKGTVVSNNGAVNLMTGTILSGRALSTTGAVTTAALNGTATVIPSNCITVAVNEANKASALEIYPNPFTGTVVIKISAASVANENVLEVYNALGAAVMEVKLTGETTTVETNLSPGAYFYTVNGITGTVQRGKLISR